jgi:hypothetical protein
MILRPLSPWLSINGNDSVTPKQFFSKNSPAFTLGAFVSIDIVKPLHLAEEVKNASLEISRNESKEYIKKAYSILGIDINRKKAYFNLDNEEKRMIVDELGEPPIASYNLYFITVTENKDERLVYIGKCASKTNRFVNGHYAMTKLHEPKYNGLVKKIYFGTIMLLDDDGNYLPLELITPFSKASTILSKVENHFIKYFKPELNRTSGKSMDCQFHIQNYIDESTFLNDVMVYPT